MSEIVYNIQQPQGTQERTVEQPGIDMSQLYRVAGQEAEAGLNAIGKVYSKISEDKKKTKDYGPLVRALQDYNDTITAENIESTEEQKLWDDLVRWAAPFYSSDEIRSWSERTGTKTYTDRLDTMRKAEIANKQTIDENLQREAMLRYPELPAREAKAKYFNEISDTLNAINTLRYNSARTPEDAERVTMLAYGPLLKAVSNQIADAKAARGGAAFSSAEFGIAITDSFNWLREQKVPTNIASLITSTVTDLYKADVAAGDAQLKGVKEAGESYKSMVESEAKLRDLYTNDVVRNIKVKLGDSEVPLSAVKSLRDLAGELVVDNMFAGVNGTDAYAKLAKDLSTGLGDLSPEQTAQLYTDVASAGVRGVAANTLSELNARYIAGSKTIRSFADSAKNPEQKTSIAMTLDSAMKMLTPAIKDDPRSSLLGTVMLSNQNLKSIPQEMLQQHPELMNIAKDRFDRDTDLFAAKLNNPDMQSILPIFDKSGDLKFYTFSKDDKGYSFKDIGDGYSWFGDAKTIQGTPERAGLKAMMTDYIEKTTNNTGLSSKEVKDMWNLRMLELTGMGGRMYYGQDITSRFSNGLWGTQATGEAPDITDEQANELLGYILEGKGSVPITTVKNSIYPQGTRAVVDEKNNTVYLEAPQGSSTELKAPGDGVLLATPTAGTFWFEEDGSKVRWTISNILASSLGHYSRGDTIAFKDTNNMEGITIGSSSSMNIVDRLAYTTSGSYTRSTLENVVGGIKEGFNIGVGDAPVEIIKGAAGDIAEGVSTAGGILAESGKEMAKGAGKAIKAVEKIPGIRKAKEVLNNLEKSVDNMDIEGSLNTVGNILVEAGREVLEGVSTASGMLTGAAKEVVGGVDEAVEIIKRSSSPTRNTTAEALEGYVQPVSGSYEAPAQVAPFVASKLEEASGEKLSEEDKAALEKEIDKKLRDSSMRYYDEQNRIESENFGPALASGLGTAVYAQASVNPFLIYLVHSLSLGYALGNYIAEIESGYNESEVKAQAKEAIKGLLNK